MGVYEKNADLVSIGAYKAGTNSKLDYAPTGGSPMASPISRWAMAKRVRESIIKSTSYP